MMACSIKDGYTNFLYVGDCSDDLSLGRFIVLTWMARPDNHFDASLHNLCSVDMSASTRLLAIVDEVHRDMKISDRLSFYFYVNHQRMQAAPYGRSLTLVSGHRTLRYI